MEGSWYTSRLFGREFGDSDYARPIYSYSNPTSHSNFINLQHDTHIEYRLCKFVDADQFLRCVKMCVEFTQAINTNFLDHYNDDQLDSSIEDIDEYRNHKAKITAGKLVKIFEKYSKMV
jgi:hypothetical protein